MGTDGAGAMAPGVAPELLSFPVLRFESKRLSEFSAGAPLACRLAGTLRVRLVAGVSGARIQNRLGSRQRSGKGGRTREKVATGSRPTEDVGEALGGGGGGGGWGVGGGGGVGVGLGS